MTLVVEIPSRGQLRHPLPDDAEAVCRVIAGLARVVPSQGIWSVAP